MSGSSVPHSSTGAGTRSSNCIVDCCSMNIAVVADAKAVTVPADLRGSGLAGSSASTATCSGDTSCRHARRGGLGCRQCDESTHRPAVQHHAVQTELFEQRSNEAGVGPWAGAPAVGRTGVTITCVGASSTTWAVGPPAGECTGTSAIAVSTLRTPAQRGHRSPHSSERTSPQVRLSGG